VARLLETRRLAAQLLQLTRHPVVDFGLRRERPAARRVGFPGAAESPPVKAAQEVLRRLELVVQVRDEPGAKAVRLVHLGERRLRLGYWPPGGRAAAVITPL